MSKCADCKDLVGEEWSANNGLCITCARDEVSEADTTQELDPIINIMDMWDFSPLQDEDTRRERVYKEIESLIRTEKLKLLDRLSSHQEDLFWWTGGEYEKTKAVDMRAIADERELLTKLEAEL